LPSILTYDADFAEDRAGLPENRKGIMDKLVKRVTVVQGDKGHRHATIVYENDDELEDEEESHPLRPFEKLVRHLLKAELVMAQEAYDRHTKSATRRGNGWLRDAPTNILRAQEKGLTELRKISSIEFDEDDGE
jgi:hypothetical protein